MTVDNKFITMPDGTQLAASVTLPANADGKAASGPFPTILTQTAYNKDVGAYIPPIGGANDYLVKHGYAQVVVDVRGTGRSTGVWRAFGPKEQSDYGHVVNWVTQQSWCDGKIGVYGASYLGITALLTAARDNPAIKAAFPIVPMGDAYRDVTVTGGQVDVGFIPLWMGLVTGLGVIQPSLLQQPGEAAKATVEHAVNTVLRFQLPTILQAISGDPSKAYDGPFWAVRSPLAQASKIKVPTFIVGALHGIFQRGEPLIYDALKHHTTAKLLIGPWTHIQAVMSSGLPADNVPPLDHIALQWFDQYVKGERVGAGKLPNVTQYVYGYGHYVATTDWPNPKARPVRLYLHGDQTLSTQKPARNGQSTQIVQQPLEGICSESTSQYTAGALGLTGLPCTKYDNTAEAADANYETPAMIHDMYINGPIEADIWVSTTALDAGLSVRVDDVGPNGKAFALTNGLMTVSMRAVDPTRSRYLDGQMIQPWHPFTQASVEPVKPGKPVEVSVEVFPTSALIKAGHRLRISVGPSDFPHGLPPIPDLLKSALGVLTIYSDAAHPSSVVLPVVPASSVKSTGQAS